MEKTEIEVKIKVKEELWQEFKETVKQRTGSKKALSGTIGNLIHQYLDNPSDHTRTHMPKEESITEAKTRKITERILYDPMYATGVTNQETIQKLIMQTIGGDKRTISRYTPLVHEKLKENGFISHPLNNTIMIQKNSPAYEDLIINTGLDKSFRNDTPFKPEQLTDRQEERTTPYNFSGNRK